MRRRDLLAAGATALLLLSCERPRQVLEIHAPVVLEATSSLAEPGDPWTLFDRRASSLIAGEGWSQTQRDPTTAGVDRYSVIALGDLSKLHFPWPGGGDLDLYLRCRPNLPDPAAPPVRLQVAVEQGSTVLTELAHGWNDLRLPISTALLPGALTTVELRFGQERSATPETPSDRARRSQWAWCSAAAVLPRDPRPPLEALAELHDLTATEDDPEPNAPAPRVRVLGIPLPSAQRLRLDLDTGALPADCPLAVRVAGAASRSVAPLARASSNGRRIEIQGDPEGVAELRLDSGAGARPECALRADGAALGDLAVFAPRPRPATARRPHVFFYLVDTLRADAVTSPYRGLLAAPHMQGFARDAVRFDSAWAASSWTLPSILSLITGLHPHRNGIWRLDQALPRDGAATLAEILTAQGYSAVGVSQTWIAGPLYGFDRGFGDYYVSEQINGTELRTNDLLALLRGWLIGRWTGDRPILAYLHSVEPHAPYSPRAEDLVRFGGTDPSGRIGSPLPIQLLRDLGQQLSDAEMGDVLAVYHAEVAFADRAFGRFLDLLRATGLYDESIVVLLSDHGEEFREHGGFGHGRNLYGESTRVPLMVKFPYGRWGGSRVAEGVSLTDLVPTLLDYLQIEVDPELGLDGSSLLPVIGGTERGRRVQISEVVTKREGPESESKFYRSLRMPGARCIHVAPFEPHPGGEERWIFLREDAATHVEAPLAEDAAAARVCRETLSRFEKSLGPERGTGTSFRLTDDQVEALRSLGYL